MTEISFYHLTSLPLEKAMPKLLEKIISSGARAIVRAANMEEVLKHNDLLWTYSTRTFLAHGTANDKYPELQPIYITYTNENPNKAKFLVLTDDIEVENIGEFDKCLDIFDGSDENKLEAARKRYKKYKQLGHEIIYWKQNSQGIWEKN